MPELRPCPGKSLVCEDDRLWYTYKNLPFDEYLCCEECYHYFIKDNVDIAKDYHLLNHGDSTYITSSCDYYYRKFNQIQECPMDKQISRKDRNWYTYKDLPISEFACCEQCFTVYMKGTDKEELFNLHKGPLNNCSCNFPYRDPTIIKPCPGKIGLPNKDRTWYTCIYKNNCVCCEECFEKYINDTNLIYYFKLLTNGEFKCNFMLNEILMNV